VFSTVIERFNIQQKLCFFPTQCMCSLWLSQ